MVTRRTLLIVTSVAAAAAFLAALVMLGGSPWSKAANGSQTNKVVRVPVANASGHHTITVTCPAGICTGGRVLIQTSDGSSVSESVSVAAGSPLTETFTGLTGGAAAVDTSLPHLNCGALDSSTISLGPGGTASGMTFATFTVPGVAATVTVSC